MSYSESSKLKISRRICSCAACGTKDLVILREDAGWGDFEYTMVHNSRNCKKPYWYKIRKSINAAVNAWNNMNEEWIDGFDRVWFEVDKVYETRWDCSIEPERVRRAA